MPDCNTRLLEHLPHTRPILPTVPGTCTISDMSDLAYIFLTVFCCRRIFSGSHALLFYSFSFFNVVLCHFVSLNDQMTDMSE